MHAEDDEAWMRLALSHARMNDEYTPIGAVLVERQNSKGELRVSCFRNGPRQWDHAELAAVQSLKEICRLDTSSSQVSLYVTLEPCPMCMGAIRLARIPCLVYGAKNHRLGGEDNNNLLVPKAWFPKIVVRGGVLQEECGLVLQRFFRALR
jgi:tRNA(adenine34) deaminase